MTEGPLGVAGRVAIAGPQGILLLRRSAASELDPGCWELPGGKMDYGEPLTRALNREVREETGLTVQIGRPLLVWHLHRAPFWVTGVTFIGRLVAGEVALSSEHDAYGWYSVPEALQLRLATSVQEQIEACADLSGER